MDCGMSLRYGGLDFASACMLVIGAGFCLQRLDGKGGAISGLSLADESVVGMW